MSGKELEDLGIGTAERSMRPRFRVSRSETQGRQVMRSKRVDGRRGLLEAVWKSAEDEWSVVKKELVARDLLDSCVGVSIVRYILYRL